jgi:acyl carrier protein
MVEMIDGQVEAVSEQIAVFIVENLEWEGTEQELLALDDPVELPAVLDSADLMELAGYLEDEFDIMLADEEIIAENFASVRHLAQLIVGKLADAGAA